MNDDELVCCWAGLAMRALLAPIPPLMSVETQPQLGGDVEIDREEMEKVIKDYKLEPMRYMATQGVRTDPLPEVYMREIARKSWTMARLMLEERP